MTFEADLEHLAKLIKDSRDQQLQEAFSAFLKSLKLGLAGYFNFLRTSRDLLKIFSEQQWDVVFEQK